jgi:catechol 2,3-dioxygenase-like lactoylglutathione lyase family enzyme
MMQVFGVAEAVLYVTDLDQATQFYTKVLNLPLTASFGEARFLQTGRDSTLILFDVEGIRRRKSSIPSHGAIGAGHVALAVPVAQMDDWRQRLIAHNVTIEHEQDWPQGTHSIYFRDPDNNSLELIDGTHYGRIWEQFWEGGS